MSDSPISENLVGVDEFDRRLKLADEARWLATRYAPQREREGLVALYLFHSELNRALGASEAMLGKIRVQWWREAIDAIASQEPPRRHDLVIELDRLFSGSTNVVRGMLEMVDSYDDILDDHLHGGHSDTEAHLARHLSVGGALGRVAGCVLDDALSDTDRITLTLAGNMAISASVGRSGDADWDADIVKLRASVSKLRAHLWPAIAHLAASPAISGSTHVGPLAMRWRIFLAILLRRL